MLRFDGANDFLTFNLPVNGLGGMSVFLVAANTANPSGVTGPQNAALFWNETAAWGTVYLSPFQDRVLARFGTTQTGNNMSYTRPTSAGNLLAEGTASYNVEDFKPAVTVDGSQVELKTGELEIKGVPKLTGANVKNEWDLQLGNMPMDLSIQAGAYRGEFELGTLAVNSLDVGDGASDVDLVFSAPNRVPMTQFRYNTGASNVTLSGLANANFSSCYSGVVQETNVWTSQVYCSEMPVLTLSQV